MSFNCLRSQGRRRAGVVRRRNLGRAAGAVSARLKPVDDGSLDAGFEMENLITMPALSPRAAKSASRKVRAAAKRKASNKGPSFGEWARRVAGIVRSGRGDLSTREGFGD